MLVQFEKVEETKTKIFQPEIVHKLKKEHHLQDLFWFCECLHLNTGHSLCVGKCDYDYCKCHQFRPKEFEMKIIITKLDVFSYENPDLVYDSPTFWVEFEEWGKMNG